MHGSAEAVADEVPPTLGVIEPVDEHTCVLRVGSDSLDQLAVWTAAFGFDFDIHEPPELITHIRALTQRLGRAAWPDRPVSPAGSPRDPGRTTGGPRRALVAGRGRARRDRDVRRGDLGTAPWTADGPSC